MSDLTLRDQHLLTGIGIIDDEHQRLVDMIICLGTAVSEGKSYVLLSYLLEDLTLNTVKHFDHEEALMRQYNYAHAAQHIKEHNKLISEITVIWKNLENGKVTISQDLPMFLHDWWYTHILDEDMKLGEALVAIGVK